MTTRKVQGKRSSRHGAAKSKRITSSDVEPKKPAIVPATPAPEAPKPERTFTLGDIARMFGGNRGPIDGEADPLSVAIDMIEDLSGVIFLVNESVHGDESGVGEVLTAAWNRAGAAIKILDGFRDADFARRNAEVTP